VWRIAPHAVLAVDDEFLRQHVEQLLVVGNRHGARGLERALDVARRHLLLLDRHHAARVEGADVAAGDADVDLADAAVRHQLGLLQHALDRGHRRVDVDHHALLEAA